MRILYLTSVDATGADAPAVHVRGTCQALSAAGHDVALAHAVSMPERRLQAEWLGRCDGLLWPRVRGGWRCFELMVALRLPAILRDWRPDLIYARISPGRAIVRALARSGVPIVIEVNGIEVLANPRFRELVNVARLALADHPVLAARLRDSVPEQADKIRQHDTFVTDATIFHPRDRAECCKRLNLKPDVFRLLHVSSFQNWHDFGTLFHGLSLLADAVDRDIELVLVGSGERGAEVRRMAAGIDRRVQVIFAGRVEHDLVADFIGASDLTIDLFTREKLESGKDLGAYKLYEYAASDRPVITAVSAGFVAPDWAQETFGLIPPEDPHALAEAIRAVIRDPLSWRGRARRAGDFVRRDRTWEAATETTLIHLREIVAEQRTRSERGEPGP